MAGIKDILEMERSRQTADDYRKIHIFQEGSFYRAYQFSAWLCTMYMKDFKVTHRQMKGIDGSVCFVGFPVTSLEKWTPQDSKTEQVAEKHQSITLAIQAEDSSQMMQQYEEWKSSIPLSETKEKEMVTKTDGAVKLQSQPASATLRNIFEKDFRWR